MCATIGSYRCQEALNLLLRIPHTRLVPRPRSRGDGGGGGGGRGRGRGGGSGLGTRLTVYILS